MKCPFCKLDIEPDDQLIVEVMEEEHIVHNDCYEGEHYLLVRKLSMKDVI